MDIQNTTRLHQEMLHSLTREERTAVNHAVVAKSHHLSLAHGSIVNVSDKYKVYRENISSILNRVESILTSVNILKAMESLKKKTNW